MKRIVLLFTVILFLSCEKNITTECEDNTTTVEPTLSSIQQNVFTPLCVGCHSGAAPQGNLDLSEGNAFVSLVNAPASGANMLRVVPGRSDLSYLMVRLKGEKKTSIMPPSGKLPSQTIEAIAAWIDDGAKQN